MQIANLEKILVILENVGLAENTGWDKLLKKAREELERLKEIQKEMSLRTEEEITHELWQRIPLIEDRGAILAIRQNIGMLSHEKKTELLLLVRKLLSVQILSKDNREDSHTDWFLTGLDTRTLVIQIIGVCFGVE